MRTRLALVVLAVAASGVAACGSQSEEDKIRETTLRFSRAFANGDTGTACGLMSTEAKSQLAEGSALLGGGSCAKTLAIARGFVDKADLAKIRDLKIKQVTISGDRATVKTTANIDSDSSDETRLIRKNGEWLIAPDPSSESDTADSATDTTGTGDTTDTTETDPPSDATDGDTTSAAQTTVGLGEPLRQDDYTVTVLDVRTARELPGSDYSDPVRADGEFTILELRVRNNGKEKATFDTSAVELVDADGTVYSADTGGGDDQIGALPNYLDEREIQPKTSERGAVAFDLPKVANVVKAQFASSLDLFDDDFTGAVTLDNP